ncbi:Lrp/AsnC family transcriptional regulator [Actinoallomurus vinaceus]|uniref:Lrp/AsnC family transcriptional regulator n=1 Tax=Actinoallomurus vinaceus TaxID=1080074 RepID=A0ABP8UL83_9ACTN
MNDQVDETDLAILRLLQTDGRATHAAIGKAVGLTGPSVYARIKRMERDGIIRGYTALIDPAALDQGLVAIVRVSLKASADEQEPFESIIGADPQVLECHDVDGEDSYILKVRTASPQTLRRLLADLRGVPGVTRTVSSIALETVKDVTATAVLGPVAEARDSGRTAEPAEDR